MKDLLKFSKNLEIDFVNSNSKYQSKIDLGISSLVTGNFDKALDMFDAAIEIDSQFPSAWLGLAFAEIANVEDEDFNSLTIDEYLNRAMRTSNNILNYKVALAGCLAYRHAALINKYVHAVEEAIKLKKEAQTAAAIGALTAAAGSTFAGKNKSIGSNIVGGSMIVGGASYATHSLLKAQELKTLGSSIYTAALSQTYLSIPIIHLCGTLEENIEDKNLRKNFKIVLDSWKDSVIYLFNKERDQLLTRLGKINISNAEDIQKLLNDPNSIQEVGEFASFMKIVGLENHKISALLNNLFIETLPAYFSNPEAISGLEAAKKKQKKYNTIGAVLLLFGIFGFAQAWWLGLFFDALCIYVGFWLADKAKTNEMRDFEKIYAEAISEIKSIAISKNDFNLNQIGT